MLCRIEMPTNEQTYGRFHRYLIFKGPDSSSRNNMAMMAVFGVILAIFVATTNMNILVSVLIVALVAAYIIYLLYIRPTQIFNKKEGIALQTEVYIFSDSNFTRSVRSEMGGLPDNSFTRYDGLQKVVETSKDFYFFTAPSQAYIADKEYFTKGSPEDMRKYFSEILGKRFITKQK